MNMRNVDNVGISSDLRYDLYINGDKILEDIAIDTQSGTINSLTQLQFGLQQQWDTTINAFGATSTWYDNVDVATYTKYPAIDEYTAPMVAEVTPYYFIFVQILKVFLLFQLTIPMVNLKM